MKVRNKGSTKENKERKKPKEIKTTTTTTTTTTTHTHIMFRFIHFYIGEKYGFESMLVYDSRVLYNNNNVAINLTMMEGRVNETFCN